MTSVHGDLAPQPDAADLAHLDDPQSFDRAIALLALVTDVFLDDVRALDDAGVREPSACAGWTRAHVISHVARNADAFCHLLAWARTGTETPMYASRAARDADIETGASRSAAELEADAEASGERLLAGLADLPPSRRSARVRGGSGAEMPAHDILWGRLREVAYHHVDLRTGRTFEDLPRPVVARGLTEAVDRLAAAAGAPGLTLTPDDGPGPLVVGDGGTRVRGRSADLLGWLTGREDGARLTCDGPLPDLPDWG